MLARLIGEDVELRVDLAPELGCVLGDVGQLQQVLLNLAVNARDAMPRGGVLTVETRNVRASATSAPTEVVLCVSDTGVGMPPEVQSHIFEPFFTTKAAGMGTGLGLSTVYGIVTQSAGYINVSSVLGSGSRFEIHLPCVQSHPAARTVVDPRPASKGSETILLVEDEES